MKRQSTPAPKTEIRCAIYTRKSTEEGLQQEFNSLDAQRESAEAYIGSQKNEGWTCLPDRYDDGGFSGGNMDRPGLRTLIADIEAGKVDCVVVYKVDRLSRSLMDFARIMGTFDEHKVSFVSVTQAFNTTHSMGRLTLNILLSFAQFERELISERTRDKIAAARRRGKYAGGRPVLGYDVVSGPTGSKLVINEDEAERVRAIFDLYLKHEALLPVVKELARRGWRTKLWKTRGGGEVGGKPFDKCILFKLLTNVLYTGKVAYGCEVFAGEHKGIITPDVWQRVQAILLRNRRTGGALVRNKHGALLKGILRCEPCACAMAHAYTAKGNKRYRYYVCTHAQKRGWESCPTKSVPAGEIEGFVIEQIKEVGRDPSVLAETLRQVQGQNQKKLAELRGEARRLQAKLKRNPETHETTEVEQRLREIGRDVVRLEQEAVDEHKVRSALAAFTPVWDTLAPREQGRIVRLLVERVDYDGTPGNGSVTVHFRPHGIRTLAGEQQEAA
jgi:site-specific DNA recombinase